MQKEIFKKVAELIAVNNDIAVETITIDSTFEQLNMDSLAGLSLINDLEEYYKISISDAVAMKIRAVRDAVDSLEKLGVNQK